MASKPRLNEDDYEQIETYLDTAPFERSPEDLLPDDADHADADEGVGN